MSDILKFSAKPVPKVAFQRSEMRHVLDAYGRLVAAGEARDYGISMYPDKAVFAIFRHAAEDATWRIEKIPALARKQGAYVVMGSAGQVLKRGSDLGAVLRVFDRKRFNVVEG